MRCSESKLSYHYGSEVHQKSDLNCRIYQDWSEEYNLPSRQRESEKMARESSTKQDEEATTEEVPRSIAIYTEKEITM